MLDLALKGVITIEPINEKEFNIILNFEKTEGLPIDEKTIFNAFNRPKTIPHSQIDSQHCPAPYQTARAIGFEIKSLAGQVDVCRSQGN